MINLTLDELQHLNAHLGFLDPFCPVCQSVKDKVVKEIAKHAARSERS